MSAINVNSITGRTGTHGPVLTGITTATNGIHVTGGSVGIGTDNPTTKLYATDTQNGYVSYTFVNDSDGSGAVNRIQLGNDASPGSAQLVVYGSQHSTLPNVFDINNANNNDMRLLTNNTERLRITSSGNVGIGTTTPNNLLCLAGSAPRLEITDTDTSGRFLIDCQSSVGSVNMRVDQDNVVANSAFIVSNDGEEKLRITSNGNVGIGTDNPTVLLDLESTSPTIRLTDSDATGTPECQISGAGGDLIIAADRDNQKADSLISFTVDGSERLKINPNGDVATTGDTSFIRTTAGFTARNGDSVNVTRSAGSPLEVVRTNGDGVLVNFFRDNTAIGTISVSSGTVSYNPFLGSHWARLEDDSKPEILVGTILETVNKLLDWRIATFTVNGEQKISTYHGPANVGDTVQIEYEGQTYDAIVSFEEDPTDSLNKHVCVKVSDTAASAGVYGVFLGWDEDVQSEYINTWNDLYCAAVGNYFIRIASGQTVAIGDLIESDGNGCGVVQSDDIIRSKTVGKVTSTIPQETYDDGSFLVTCVLCCG